MMHAVYVVVMALMIKVVDVLKLVLLAVIMPVVQHSRMMNAVYAMVLVQMLVTIVMATV